MRFREIRLLRVQNHGNFQKAVFFAYQSHRKTKLDRVLFTSVNLVKQLIENTTTSKGLKVFVKIIETIYQTGRKTADNFKQTMRIVLDDFLPAWNYRAIPNSIVN